MHQSKLNGLEYVLIYSNWMALVFERLASSHICTELNFWQNWSQIRWETNFGNFSKPQKWRVTRPNPKVMLKNSEILRLYSQPRLRLGIIMTLPNCTVAVSKLISASNPIVTTAGSWFDNCLDNRCHLPLIPCIPPVSVVAMPLTPSVASQRPNDINPCTKYSLSPPQQIINVEYSPPLLNKYVASMPTFLAQPILL